MLGIFRDVVALLNRLDLGDQHVGFGPRRLLSGHDLSGSAPYLRGLPASLRFARQRPSSFLERVCPAVGPVLTFGPSFFPSFPLLSNNPMADTSLSVQGRKAISLDNIGQVVRLPDAQPDEGFMSASGKSLALQTR